MCIFCIVFSVQFDLEKSPEVTEKSPEVTLCSRQGNKPTIDDNNNCWLLQKETDFTLGSLLRMDFQRVHNELLLRLSTCETQVWSGVRCYVGLVRAPVKLRCDTVSGLRGSGQSTCETQVWHSVRCYVGVVWAPVKLRCDTVSGLRGSGLSTCETQVWRGVRVT